MITTKELSSLSAGNLPPSTSSQDFAEEIKATGHKKARLLKKELLSIKQLGVTVLRLKAI
ncbi:MAG: hypothetical protein V7L21_28025 [Nostoc sp.]|uniref:hypothetical protein n=1 Tax=Nostoc sp. TaxID=1180 RepID=UPI002FFA298B